MYRRGQADIQEKSATRLITDSDVSTELNPRQNIDGVACIIALKSDALSPCLLEFYSHNKVSEIF